MSASRERKKRIAASEQAAVPAKDTKKKKKKWNETIIFAIVVILIPVLVFGIIFGVQTYWRSATVLTVGNHEVSTAQFNYFYRSAVNTMYSNYGSYISLLGIDSATPLDEQAYVSGDQYETWADYFIDSAKTSAVNLYAVYDAAVAAGFTLDEEAQAEIDTEISNLNVYATLYGMEVDDYVEAIYGKGCDLESYRKYLELTQTHDAYIQSLQYTDEELTARYEQDTTEFDTVSYDVYTVRASEFSDETDENGGTVISDENRASAKAAADEMAADFNEDDENTTHLTERLKSEVTSSISEEAAEWLFTEAKAGDVNVFQVNDTYYVVKAEAFSDNDYPTVNALQIYIAKDAEDEELGEDDKTSDQRVEELRAALESDASEEKFREYMTTYGDTSSSTTISNATHRSVTDEEISAWLFDSSRKAGDYKEFTDDSGNTTVVYFQEFDDTYKKLLVSSTLTNEWYEATTEAVTYDFDADAAKHSNVSLILNNIYGSSTSSY